MIPDETTSQVLTAGEWGLSMWRGRRERTRQGHRSRKSRFVMRHAVADVVPGCLRDVILRQSEIEVSHRLRLCWLHLSFAR